MFQNGVFWKKLCLAGTVLLLSASLASSTFGAIRVRHSAGRFGWDYEHVDMVVTGRGGFVVIDCDAQGNSVVVDRNGDYIYVTEINPSGPPGKFSYSIRDPNRWTAGILFKGGPGPDVYENNTPYADEVYGNSGNDWITCGFGYSYVKAGSGDDVVYLRTSKNPGQYNQVFGDLGGDVIYGSEFSDFILGGENGDYIEGRGGDDYLLGDSGGDVLFGNEGIDRLGGGFDGVPDLMSGGEGSDEYTFHAYPGTSVNIGVLGTTSKRKPSSMMALIDDESSVNRARRLAAWIQRSWSNRILAMPCISP